MNISASHLTPHTTTNNRHTHAKTQTKAASGHGHGHGAKTGGGGKVKGGGGGSKAKKDKKASVAEEENGVRCICGYTHDDHLTVQCEKCFIWYHIRCFGYSSTDELGDGAWYCTKCAEYADPPDPEHARALQDRWLREQKQNQLLSLGGAGNIGNGRKGSVKQRTQTHTQTVPNKPSIINNNVDPFPSIPPLAPAPAQDEDPYLPPGQDSIEIDILSPEEYYVPLTQDKVTPHPSVLATMRRYYHGVSALTSAPSPFDEPWEEVKKVDTSSNAVPYPRTSVLAVPNSFSKRHFSSAVGTTKHAGLDGLAAGTGTEDDTLAPPSFALHTLDALSQGTLVTPLVSHIKSSTAFLREADLYSLTGHPPPFLHLLPTAPAPSASSIGTGAKAKDGLVLDTRGKGNKARWVRWGCHPNAKIEPYVSTSSSTSTQDEGEQLKFGVFATKEMKADEEVVVGWEWDDASAVHSLPRLVCEWDVFPPRIVEHRRRQLANIVHSLRSSFVRCACPSPANCILEWMQEFVDTESDPDALEALRQKIPKSFIPSSNDGVDDGVHGRLVNGAVNTVEPPPVSEDEDEDEEQEEEELEEREREKEKEKRRRAKGKGKAVPPPDKEELELDLGPTLGTARGFRAKEKVPWSGGWGGCEFSAPEGGEAGPSTSSSKSRKDKKGKGRAGPEEDWTYDSRAGKHSKEEWARIRREKRRKERERIGEEGGYCLTWDESLSAGVGGTEMDVDAPVHVPVTKEEEEDKVNPKMRKGRGRGRFVPSAPVSAAVPAPAPGPESLGYGYPRAQPTAGTRRREQRRGSEALEMLADASSSYGSGLHQHASPSMTYPGGSYIPTSSSAHMVGMHASSSSTSYLPASTSGSSTAQMQSSTSYLPTSTSMTASSSSFLEPSATPRAAAAAGADKPVDDFLWMKGRPRRVVEPEPEPESERHGMDVDRDTDSALLALAGVDDTDTGIHQQQQRQPPSYPPLIHHHRHQHQQQEVLSASPTTTTTTHPDLHQHHQHQTASLSPTTTATSPTLPLPQSRGTKRKRGEEALQEREDRRARLGLGLRPPRSPVARKRRRDEDDEVVAEEKKEMGTRVERKRSESPYHQYSPCFESDEGEEDSLRRDGVMGEVDVDVERELLDAAGGQEPESPLAAGFPVSDLRESSQSESPTGMLGPSLSSTNKRRGSAAAGARGTEKKKGKKSGKKREGGTRRAKEEEMEVDIDVEVVDEHEHEATPVLQGEDVADGVGSGGGGVLFSSTHPAEGKENGDTTGTGTGTETLSPLMPLPAGLDSVPGGSQLPRHQEPEHVSPIREQEPVEDGMVVDQHPEPELDAAGKDAEDPPTREAVTVVPASPVDAQPVLVEVNGSATGPGEEEPGASTSALDDIRRPELDGRNASEARVAAELIDEKDVAQSVEREMEGVVDGPAAPPEMLAMEEEVIPESVEPPADPSAMQVEQTAVLEPAKETTLELESEPVTVTGPKEVTTELQPEPEPEPETAKETTPEPEPPREPTPPVPVKRSLKDWSSMRRKRKEEEDEVKRKEAEVRREREEREKEERRARGEVVDEAVEEENGEVEVAEDKEEKEETEVEPEQVAKPVEEVNGAEKSAVKPAPATSTTNSRVLVDVVNTSPPPPTPSSELPRAASAPRHTSPPVINKVPHPPPVSVKIEEPRHPSLPPTPSPLTRAPAHAHAHASLPSAPVPPKPNLPARPTLVNSHTIGLYPRKVNGERTSTPASSPTRRTTASTPLQSRLSAQPSSSAAVDAPRPLAATPMSSSTTEPKPKRPTTPAPAVPLTPRAPPTGPRSQRQAGIIQPSSSFSRSPGGPRGLGGYSGSRFGGPGVNAPTAPKAMRSSYLSDSGGGAGAGRGRPPPSGPGAGARLNGGGGSSASPP